MWKLSVRDVMSLVGGKLLAGNADGEITGFASLKEASRGDLSFFHDHRYEARLQATRASVVLMQPDCPARPAHVVCIGVSDPSRSFEVIVEAYGIQPHPFAAGVHPSAVVAASVRIDPTKTSVGPNAVIDERAIIGDGAEIGAGCYVGQDVVIGRDTKLHANSTVHTGCEIGDRVILHSAVVIGADGFGYEFEKGRHRKVRQSGIVQLDNDVEIGAGTTIDRARFGRTWIGEGTKIDNLVQIGHNVVIGKHCIIVACSAIAGSAVIGDYVVVAAQVGIAGHVNVGSQSKLGGRAGVTKDVPPGKTYFGFPARDANEERRRIASVSRLPQLMERVKELEKRLEKMECPEGACDGNRVI
jgi:UDP-3-O-[3-hydroxymyristoyl] glucosamine N-acyltransferase